ncbi:hypothetical protein O3G_MSEX009757 [Manduca sexta]|uniref:Uncharacterized protein n=1 Tax=Manduca sexta TaxID=7130 RepID=A0A922CSS1_MANSE|nr:hypothetical protein O3G_MSEX009757 [Manduca sexta]
MFRFIRDTYKRRSPTTRRYCTYFHNSNIFLAIYVLRREFI